MSSIVSTAFQYLLDFGKSQIEKHPRKFRLMVLIAAYFLLRRMLTKRKSIRDQVVVVTGGASGLGLQLAARFAHLGARVVLWDMNEASLSAVSQQIASAGGQVWAYAVDVTDKSSVDQTADRVKREVGKVDILVNNAGIVSGKSIVDLTQQDIEKTFQMIATNRGHICTIASGAGHLGINKLTDYCASKFGAVGLDESLRMELKRKGLNGVLTTCCSSYFMATGQFEGVKTSSDWLLPVLDEAYVADMVVEAILTNQAELRMPRLLYFVPLFKFVLPTPAFDKVVSMLGLNNSLDDFHGRMNIRLHGARATKQLTVANNINTNNNANTTNLSPTSTLSSSTSNSS